MAQVSVATPGTRQSVSLYVGNLASDVTEANLMETFSQVGAVASIRVCRDFFTRRSLGYAYVNYLNPADAERALDALNYITIKDRNCRIMWSQRDPSVRKSGQGNIFIKDLHKSIDNKSLHDTFSAFGNILSCRLMTDEHGHSRGFGFVHFESAEAAEMAIQKVNGMLMEDKKVYVGPYLSRKERTPRFDELQKTFTNVFVKNLDPKVSREELINMFKVFGNITSAVVMVDPSGKSKGFGFVNFSDHSSAEKACENLNESDHHGKKLYVGRAQKADERRQKLQREYEVRPEKINRYLGSNLYVKNLEDSIDEEKLKQVFKEFGTITSCRVMVDERGVQKGYGFVCFSSPEEAYRALSEMNGKIIATKPLYVNIFQTKMQRRQFLENNYLSRMYPHQMPMWPMTNGMQVPPRNQYPSYYRPFMSQSPQPDMLSYNSPLNRGPRPQSHPRSNPRPQGRMDQQKPKTRGPNHPYESGYEYSQEQTQQFGNKIYGVLVQNSYTPDMAGKITGMLLQMPLNELAQVSDSPEDIMSRASECVQRISMN